MRYANKAIEVNPKHAYPHLAKADVFLALDRDADALAELETAFDYDPQNAQLQVEIGDVCLRNLNRAAEALEHYRRATELNPILVPALLRLADLHLRLGQTNEAQSAFMAARRIAPEESSLRDLERQLSPGAFKR